MKFSVFATVTLLAGSAAAFAPRPQSSQKSTTSILDAANRSGAEEQRSSSWLAPVATAAIGWALGSQISLASPVIPTETVSSMVMDQQSTIVIADAMSLDFSLPSTYDASSKNAQGFGDGAEAILNRGSSDGKLTDPGADEKQKQAESMRKAEEARKARMAADKAKKKEMEEEAKIREAAKKKEKAERLKNIWN